MQIIFKAIPVTPLGGKDSVALYGVYHFNCRIINLFTLAALAAHFLHVSLTDTNYEV